MTRAYSRLLCVIVIATSAIPSHAGASWPGDNGRIGYVGVRNGNRVILSMLPNGDDVLQISTGRHSEREHSFSPDGTKVVLSRQVSDERSDLFVMDIDGSHATRLTRRKLSDIEATWAADGTEIIYSHQNKDGHYDLFTMAADGSNKQRVVAVRGNEFWPRSSPDGDVIAYVKGYRGLHLMDADGSNRRTLASWTHGHADWHPDGERLVIEGSGPDLQSPGVYIVDELGLTTQLVVEGSGWTEPVFSPDGTKIVAQRYYTPADDDMQTGIYTMNLDGSDLTLIRKNAEGSLTHIDWQAI